MVLLDDERKTSPVQVASLAFPPSETRACDGVTGASGSDLDRHRDLRGPELHPELQRQSSDIAEEGAPFRVSVSAQVLRFPASGVRAVTRLEREKNTLGYTTN